MAIVVTVADMSGERIIAVGRYIRNSKEDEAAEVSFMVRDDWQNRGIGRILLEKLISIARDRGIKRFMGVGTSEVIR